MRKNKKLLSNILTILLIFTVLFMGILPTQNVVYAADGEAHANLLERAISALFVVSALGVYALISVAAGGKISIEDLIFNQYSKTRLTFFEDSINNTNTYLDENMLITTINDYFSFFSRLAILAYLIILVYMGIRILLGVGSARGAKYKELILYWVQGIFILFFFPYIIKYTITINDAFVEFIYDNKDSILTMGQVASDAGYTAEIPAGAGGDLTSLNQDINNVANSLNNESNQDYMSVVYRLAWKEGWLVYAVAWITMVYQLLSLLVIYFKRLLTVIFLIAIFPLVTISYAVDKIGDGKSQAFGNWYKEFALNIFLQSFHAIVYVIGMALILTLGTATNTALSEHWLLIILIITFISKGDEMLRGIFNMKGGGGDTVKSVGATMLQTKGAVELVKSTRKAVSDTFGAKSNFGKATQHIGNMRDQAINMGANYAAISAATVAQAQDDAQNQMPDIPVADMSAPRTLADYAETALDRNATEEERNQALNEILAVINSGDEEALNKLAEHFKDDKERLNELEDLLKTAAAANAIMAGGLTEVELRQKIEILLEQMNKGGYHARIGKRVARTPEELQKLQEMSRIKFKKPEPAKATSKKSTRGRKSGAAPAGTAGVIDSRARYAGVFVPGGRNVKPAPKTFRQKVVAKGAAAVTTVNRFKATYKAGKNLKSYEKEAMRELRRLNDLQDRVRNLERDGKADTKEYQVLIGRIKTLQRKGGSIDRLRQKRAEYAERGIYTLGVGKTQRTIDRRARYERRKKLLAGTKDMVVGSYRDATANIKANREAKQAVKEARELREKAYLSVGQERKLKQLEAFVDGRVSTASMLFGNRPGGKGRVRMTAAQRMLNRDRNKSAVRAAKDAIWCRKQATLARGRNDSVTAQKYDAHASELETKVATTRRTSFRSYNPNDEVRKETKAQRMIDKSAQKRAAKVMRQAGKYGYDSATVKAAAETRQKLRDNGVLITRKSAAEVMYNKPILRQARRDEAADIAKLLGIEIRTAAQMISDRKANQSGQLEKYNKEKQIIGERLRKHGVVVRPPNLVSRAASAVNDMNRREAQRNARGRAKTNWERTNENAYNGYKSTKANIEKAEAQLRDARKLMQEANGDIGKIERAKKKEKEALAIIAAERKLQKDIYVAIKKSRANLVKAGVKLSLGSKTERLIVSDIAEDYQRVAKDERIAERKASRENARLEGQKRRIQDSDTSIRLISESEMDTPIRRMAKSKKAKKQTESAPKSSVMASKLRELGNNALAASQVRESTEKERQIIQGIAREIDVSSYQGTRSRISEKVSNFASDISSIPGRASDFARDVGVGATTVAANAYVGGTELYRAATNTPSQIVDAIRGVPQMASRAKQAVTSIPGEMRSLSSEIMQMASVDNFKKQPERTSSITVNGFHKPYVPSTSNTTSDRTTIFIREGSVDSVGQSDVVIGGIYERGTVVLNTRAEAKKANEYVSKIVSRRKTSSTTSDDGTTSSGTASDNSATTTSTTSTSSKPVAKYDVTDPDLYSLACSIVAINQAESGAYTASEMVAHIENIKALKKAASQNPQKAVEAEEMLLNLRHDLNDFESNLRIQVLNDPTLLGDDDPNRRRIMDDSIAHVQSMSLDNILLSTLNYEPEDLVVGQVPIARYGKSYGSAAVTGFAASAAEESAIQSALAASLREKARREQIEVAEREIAASKVAMGKEAVGFVKSTAGAAVDFAIGVPVSMGTGFMAAGAAGTPQKGGIVTLNAATTAMAGYSLGNKAFKTASGFVGDRIDDVTTVAGSVASRLGSSSKPSSASKKSSNTGSNTPTNAVDYKKASLRGKTNMPDGELSKRLNNNGSSGGKNT